MSEKWEVLALKDDAWKRIKSFKSKDLAKKFVDAHPDEELITEYYTAQQVELGYHK